MGLRCHLPLIKHHIVNKAILRSPGKQLEPPFEWLVFDILPQVASCLAFVGNHDLIHRLLGSLLLTPEGSSQEAEQWPDLKKSIDGATDLRIVIEVDHPLHHTEPLQRHNVGNLWDPGLHCPVVSNRGQLNNSHVCQDCHKIHHLIYTSSEGGVDVLLRCVKIGLVRNIFHHMGAEVPAEVLMRALHEVRG